MSRIMSRIMNRIMNRIMYRVCRKYGSTEVHAWWYVPGGAFGF